MSPNTRPLIPVTLREAALDSPTFRGIVQSFGDQVDNFEKWLDGYLRAATKLCSEMQGLEDVVKAFVQKAIPNNAFELVLDYDYTHLAMRRFAQGSREYWNDVFGGIRRFERTVVEPLLQLQRSELKNFKELRRQLESAQSKYDTMLARYASQSKTKPPSSLREDAFQVYEARKLYLRLCFDFCITAPSIRLTLDRVVTRILSDQWRENRNLRSQATATLDKYGTEMERIRHWSDSLELGEKALMNELMHARNQIEEATKQEAHPGRDLEEYSASTVPYLTSSTAVVKAKTSGQTDRTGKQGWLFMRSVASKPTRSVWIRRWFFISDGMFGYLMQGYRGGGVEESEKIGVLLSNVKPAFQEDRRFCFEVKTKDVAILLQAETQADLIAWIEVFEQAKRKAVASSSSGPSQAFSIIPPSAPAPELSVKDHVIHDENISMGFDRSLTLPLSGVAPPEGLRGAILGSRTGDGTKGKHSDAHRPLAAITPVTATGSAGLGALISATHSAFPHEFRGAQANQLSQPPYPNSGDRSAPHSQASGFPVIPTTSLAPTTLAYTPAPSGLARAATLTGLSSQPELSAFLKRSRTRPKHKKAFSLDMETLSEGTNQGLSNSEVIYPPNYPGELKAQDMHFRSLFPSKSLNQPVLLVFRCSWVLSDHNDLPGRCFVTMENVYFYSHYLGFVFRKTLSLSEIGEVTAAPGKDCDHIFFHLNPGDPDESDYGDDDENTSKMTVKVFLEPVRLLQRRLNLLIKHAHNPGAHKPNRVLLEDLVTLEGEPEPNTAPDSDSWEVINGEQLESTIEVKHAGDDRRKGLSVVSSSEPLDFAHRKEPRIKLPSEPITYEPRGMEKRALEIEFDVPAKALFHVICGHKSAIFQTLYHERRARQIHQTAWVVGHSGKLRRQFTYEIEHTDILGRSKRVDVVDSQIIDISDDYLCYVITDRKTPYHLPYYEHFMLVSKLVITYVAKSRCKFAIWTAVEWSKYPTFFRGIIQRQALDNLDTDALDLGDVLSDQIRRIGTEHRIKKAITIFGHVDNGAVEQASENLLRPPTDENEHGSISCQKRIMQHSMAYMMMETLMSLAESALSTILMVTFGALQKGWEVISAQRLLIIFLTFSVAGNLMLSSRSTMAYWTERRAARFIDDIGVKPNNIMSKAIYLKDIDDIVGNGTNVALFPSSECYSKFRAVTVGHQLDAVDFSGHATRSVARRLMGARRALGTYRHDLLVALRLINRIESQVIHSEWENWLLEESVRCRQASYMLRDLSEQRSKKERINYTRTRMSDLKFEAQLKDEDEHEEGAWNWQDDTGDSIKEVAQWIADYCSSCDAERRQLFADGKRL